MLNLADPQKSRFILGVIYIYIWDRALFVPYIYFIDKMSSSCGFTLGGNQLSKSTHEKLLICRKSLIKHYHINTVVQLHLATSKNQSHHVSGNCIGKV